MKDSDSIVIHTFHIPVMGTGFTIDTPLRVAKYGISSVISMVDDVLIEQMRKFHCENEGEPYEEITDSDEDARARRITAYLDLIDLLVQRQFEALKSSPFEKNSEITRYFEILPEIPLKRDYREMLETADRSEKEKMQERLRGRVVPGSIDVNIMTKLDREVYRNGVKLPREFSDAMSALRGFANSALRSSIVCSAGMNQHLYSYMTRFDDFFPDEHGVLRKKIILKVSDYRSAIIQGKFLAKRGLWVSEYRIESGLNCGGHAFPSRGYLLGPIMEEFKQKKQELIEMLHSVYSKTLAAHGRFTFNIPHKVRITVQGGIGTTDENEFLMKYYNIDGTGWGTPFLLVPEVANVDDKHLEKLSATDDSSVYLSDSSPLGVPFWNIRSSASEEARRRRISEGKPGSPCPKGYLKLNGDFSDVPICPASRVYQKRKLKHLPLEGLSAEQMHAVEKYVLEKSCLCHDLAGVATLKHGIDPDATPAICCGPNIVNFSKVATLEEMVGHIYGRLSLLTGFDRPHMFVKELMIYVDYLRDEVEKYSLELSTYTEKYLTEFKENLLDGIENYILLAEQFIEEQKESFLKDIKALQEEIESIPFVVTV